MHCRIVAPKEVERESERLYHEWSALPEKEKCEWGEYLRQNGSEAVRAYLHKCAEIHARLEPGERV